jgi:hypothetical protein
VKAYRDNVVSLPKMGTGGPREKLTGFVSGETDGVRAVGLAGAGAVVPADYLFNNSLIGATALHAQGNLGDGVIVGIIDSGTANSPVVAALPPGTVIGGESFVPGATEPGPTSRANGAHGTWVGTVIAGNAAFVVPSVSATSTFVPRMVASLRAQAPGSVIECATPPHNFACDPATQAVIPVVGVAPGAKIYALKVFPAAVDSTSGGCGVGYAGDMAARPGDLARTLSTLGSAPSLDTRWAWRSWCGTNRRRTPARAARRRSAARAADGGQARPRVRPAMTQNNGPPRHRGGASSPGWSCSEPH